MMFTKKLRQCAVLAGLMALMYSCADNDPAVRLLYSRTINFPSASAIECLDNRLFVFGDDATYLLELSENYEVIDSIPFLQSETKRIRKDTKPDIESAMLIQRGGVKHVLGLGSFSAANRKTAFEYSPQSRSITPVPFFSTGIFSTKIKALNIEGSCTMRDKIVLVNRGNMDNKKNQFLFIDSLQNTEVKEMILPQSRVFAGVSGLYYLKEEDLLLFTASEEETASTINDGAIGESYLGGIRHFSGKMKESSFRPDFFLALKEFDARFSRQKIESACVQKADGEGLLLHLVADNDDGSSGLFAVRLTGY